MRRADRLFQIIQVLRRTRKPLTADAIATELETSKRTIYRDIATLIGQRVPIRGEAGMGYILEKGFDLPPLMLTPDEIEAAVLGAQWVAGHADPALARAAEDLMAKIADTVPERLRLFGELAALLDRERRGACRDSRSARQRPSIRHALRRRSLFGVAGEHWKSDRVRHLCSAAGRVPHLHAGRCRMRDGATEIRAA